MLDDNKSLVRRFYDECWNKGQVERLGDIVAKECRYHDAVFPALTSGLDSLKRHIGMCRTAFPDLKFTIDDVIAERDEVVVHWTAQGTQEGAFLGIPASRKAGKVGGTSIYRVTGGKISEQFADWNLLTLLEQLGVSTTPKVQVAAR